MPSREGQERDLRPVDSTAPTESDPAELTDRCARPRCRREFKQLATRGRRREYCSDTCRGNAEREFKQAKAAEAHYARLLGQAAADLAAFGRTETPSERPSTAADPSSAREAWATARTASQFAEPGDVRLHAILTDLVDALRPLLEPGA